MPTPETVSDILERVERYQYYARLRDRAHYQMGLRLRLRERALGIPVVVLTDE
jgi:hypothetical protein